MDAATIIAIIVSICALCLTIYQGYQQRRSNQEQIYQAFVSTWFDTGRMFIEHPELRKYFYDRVPLSLSPDETEYQLAMAVAVYFDDAFAYTERQSKTIQRVLTTSYIRYKNYIETTDVWDRYRSDHPWINTQKLSDAEYKEEVIKHLTHLKTKHPNSPPSLKSNNNLLESLK